MPDLLNVQSGGQITPGNGSFENGLNGIPAGSNPMDFFLSGIPGYQFAFDQGQRGVQSQAFAQGTGLTGGTLKKLARYGGGMGDQLYGDTVQRYLSLADLGLRGATAPFV